jgi:hypothetical protein
MKQPLVPVAIILAAAMLTLTGAIMVSLRQAQATNVYAQQTGVPCGGCHVSSLTGYRKLNAFGERFKANGYKLPKLDTQSK